MLVNKLMSKSIFVTLSLFVGMYCQAGNDGKSENLDLLSLIERKVAQATIDYGNKIEYCSNIASNGEITSLADFVDKLERDQLVVAVAHLNFRNTFLCANKEKLELLYQIGQLEKIRKEINIESLSSFAMADELDLFASKRELDLEMKYNKLPAHYREMLEKLFSEDPFDFVKTLEDNNLSIEQ